ncbi:DUF2254 domain-containing protein [Pelagerythrobacter rhizovicinus]|uniref:DUF2254 domain-containing protein n=2 Tax=Pelagerythrobacter rhizovicinus TaxID=2268576 RepID=A0A4Q2KRB3_9SPHN|nr:DUF2254 domain-containing protein [Pelagerythrobacter rhizovicinus]
MATPAVALGALTVWLDAAPAAGLLDGLSWYQAAKPDGAREVLSTIAGSMITVAGVVFSITIVAISYAASQYGPRIRTNFMSDRGNQFTSGTFIATFLYCLVVLRTVKSRDETRTNGYNMFNATRCYRLNVGLRKSVELYARGTDLANELAFSHTSFVKDQSPLRGRNIVFGMRHQF